MKNKNRVRYITHQGLRDFADKFLSKYYKSRKPPIPIEKIIEGLGIKIIAIPELKNLLGVEAYVSISQDSKSIFIDGTIYTKYLERSRFTCAHELSHIILHRKIYESALIENLQNYEKFQNSLTPEEVKRLEIQAHILAGYLMLPQKIFIEETNGLIADYGGEKQITISDLGTILDRLSQKFQISKSAIFKQFKYEFPELTEEIEKLK